MTQDDSKYTDPELREEIKEDIQAGDKGGQPGQWSARKAQMVAKEYKEQGGEYTSEKKDDSQKNLQNWGDEKWQTSDGSGTAKQDDGTEARYLPEKAWEKMTDEEKKETNEAKQEGSAAGEQHVPNTEAAKEARKDAAEDKAEDKKEDEPETEAEAPAADEEMNGKEDEAPAKEKQELIDEDEEEEEQDEPEEEQSDYEDGSDGEPPKKSRKTNNTGSAGTRNTPKRERKPAAKPAAKTPAEPSEHGEAGSTERMPEVGQKVYWKSGASMTEGEVVEILKSETMLGKRKYKASESDPRVKVKSSSTGKEAVHKPEACHWK